MHKYLLEVLTCPAATDSVCAALSKISAARQHGFGATGPTESRADVVLLVRLVTIANRGVNSCLGVSLHFLSVSSLFCRAVRGNLRVPQGFAAAFLLASGLILCSAKFL